MALATLVLLVLFKCFWIKPVTPACLLTIYQVVIEAKYLSNKIPFKMRVLVVEDDGDIATVIQTAFRREGVGQIDVVGTGSAALQAVDADPPDVMILDLNLPDIDGFSLCRRLRARKRGTEMPIIVVTARTSETDRVRAFELGADDYVTKPFGLRELTARARAVSRRATSGLQSSDVYEGQRLTADFAGVEVRVDKRPVKLTRREFQILRCLVENRNRVMSRDRLLDRVWGNGDSVDERTVDVHLGRLRSKLGQAGKHIETVFGIGYRFLDDASLGMSA
ncbi:MAG: DNA-binding response regulator [Acidobacteria bacterium]|nr:DNA-binding response regulator [Acidobacteriota bacterium]